MPIVSAVIVPNRLGKYNSKISRQDAPRPSATIGAKGGTSLENCHRGQPICPAPPASDDVPAGRRRFSADRRRAGRAVQPMVAGCRLRRRRRMARAQRPAGRRTGRFSFSGFSGGAAPHRLRHPDLLRRHRLLHHPAVPEAPLPPCRLRGHDTAGTVGVSVPAPAPPVDAMRRRADHSVGRRRAAALPDGQLCRWRDAAAGGLPAGAGPVPVRLRLGGIRLPYGRSAGRRAAAGCGAPPDACRRGGCRCRGRSRAGSLRR